MKLTAGLRPRASPGSSLVNYQNCKIFPDAWVAFAKRGKRCNLAYSRGTARFQPHEATEREIAAKAQTDNFDPNLFDSRQAAVEHLRSLREGAERQYYRSACSTLSRGGNS